MDGPTAQSDFSKEDMFRFVARLGVFTALEMDLANFSVLNQTADVNNSI